MLLFLASVLEQLDLALEHVSKDDVHNARFSLMLTDNAAELLLHQIAKNQASELKNWSHLRDDFQHKKELEDALRRSFDAKVKFAKLLGKLNEEQGQTISIIHSYRNEVYHVGLHHETILPTLAAFHFDVVCRFATAFETNGLWWGSNMVLPQRAQKYFDGDKFFPGTIEHFRNGCATMAEQCGHSPERLIEALSAHMDQIVEEADTCLDVISGGVYEGQQTTRDRATINTQAWPLAFSGKAKEFAQEKGWLGGNFPAFMEWLAQNYPFRYGKDPTPSWQKRAATLKADTDPHKALARYHSFMEETAEIREALMENAGAVEREIDAAVDRMREERAFRKERGDSD
jgi:hypothetical protein